MGSSPIIAGTMTPSTLVCIVVDHRRDDQGSRPDDGPAIGVRAAEGIGDGPQPCSDDQGRSSENPAGGIGQDAETVIGAN
jgi:hypothetical protein